MDFARPLEAVDSLAARSAIRWLPVPGDPPLDGEPSAADSDDQMENARLDRMVVDTANEVAREFLLGPGPYRAKKPKPTNGATRGPGKAAKEAAVQSSPITDTTGSIGSYVAKSSTEQTGEDEDWTPPDEWVDASKFQEHLMPQHAIIQPGDLVVIMEAFDKLDFVYVSPGEMFYNRNGHFRHDDFIGKPFGAQARSSNNRGYGFVYLLKPTPELWARSLPHRTQIVQELDQVQTVMRLQLRPNLRVLESGTGSAAMSHAILRSIAPHGRLHTFEFNRHRAEAAREEFRLHGVEHLVTVHHRDVCTDGFLFDGGGSGAGDRRNSVSPHSFDACFLDLPEPWLAIPHAVHCLKPGARLASYSPCVEQTQRACEALKKHGCHSIQTLEFRLLEHYVDEAEYDPLPTQPRPLPKPVDDEGIIQDGERTASPKQERTAVQLEVAFKQRGEQQSNGKRKRLVARPFNMMKGHTAFLTYATVGNTKQPNHLDKPEEGEQGK